MPRVMSPDLQPDTVLDPVPVSRFESRVETLRWALPLLIAALTLATFSPALRNGFVNWDDDVNLLENDGFRGLSADHLAWMFSTGRGGHYQPLTWLSFAADYAIWGAPNNRTAFGYHLTNILLHAVAVVLFYFVACRLLGVATGVPPDAPDARTCWCAGFAALVFALHPLRVESVVWVTERRDVLSAVLLFACVLWYLRAVDRRRGYAVWLVMAWVAFGLSLLSKAAGMTLPVVLIVLDVYPLRRVQRGLATVTRIVVEKIPFAILAVAAGWLAMRAQLAAGAWRPLSQFGVLERIAAAAYGAMFYIWKFLSPTRLAPLYPLPSREQLLGPVFVICLVLIAVAVMVTVAYRRQFPAIPAAMCCYVLFLAPVSGLAQSGKQLVADRYSYLSLLAVALLLAGGLLRLWSTRGRDTEGRRVVRAFQALAVLFVVGIGALAAAQTTNWRDSRTLWRWAVEVNPRNAVAQVNLAQAVAEQGDIKNAAAIYLSAIKLDPSDAKAQNGMGVTLLKLNQPVQALAFLSRAVELDKDNALYRCNLGYTLAGFGRFAEAADQYRRAIELSPRLILAYRKLGDLLVRLERYGDARDVMSEGLKHAPGDRVLRGNLAWLLATCRDAAVRDGARAVTLARGLCEQDGYEDPVTLDTLAAACAEAGDFEQAVTFAKMARGLIRPDRGDDLATRIDERIARYTRREPYRE